MENVRNKEVQRKTKQFYRKGQSSLNGNKKNYADRKKRNNNNNNKENLQSKNNVKEEK